MQPKVSIIVPCYGVEKYLDRCMESLVNQTLQEIEILLVDDGSPDRVPEMCDVWTEKDSRINVIHKENAGLGYARNSGLEMAIGEYVAFVDSDDFVDMKMYEILYNTAKEHNCDAVFCGFKKEFKPNAFLNIQECKKYTEFNGKQVRKLIPDFVANKPYGKNEIVYEMSVWHSVYKTKLIKDNQLKFVSERDYASEDIPFQIDFFTKAKRISFIPDIFYVYCYNNGSLTKRISLEKFEKIKSLYYLLLGKTKLYDKDGLRAKRLFIGNIRSFCRIVVSGMGTKSEKKEMIKVLFMDDIWKEIKPVYKPSFLPIHQRIMLIFIYRGQVTFAYYFAKFMDLKIVTIIKKWGIL